MNVEENPTRPKRGAFRGAAIAAPILVAILSITACGQDAVQGTASPLAASSTASKATGTTSPSAPTATSMSPSPDIATSPAIATTPTVTPVEQPAPTSEVSRAQGNAVSAARGYLDLTAFSRTGLIEQLEFEGYSTADATNAVDQVSPDWNDQAALAAENYLDLMPFSRQGLIEQLEFEGFSRGQATYGVDQAGL